MPTSQDRRKQRLINDFINAIRSGTLQEVDHCLQAYVPWDGQHSADGKTALYWLELNKDEYDGIAKLTCLYKHVSCQGEHECWKLHRTVACHNYAWIMQQLVLISNANIIEDSLLLREATLSGSIGVVEIICNGKLNVNGAYIDDYMEDEKWIDLPENSQREGAGEDEYEYYQIEGQADPPPLSYLPAAAIVVDNQVRPHEPTAPLVLQIAYRAMQLEDFPLRCDQTTVLTHNTNPIYHDRVQVRPIVATTTLLSQPYYQTLYQLLNILRRAGANFALVDCYRNTILHYLARHCYAKKTQEIAYYIALVALIANINFVNVDAINDRGDTALHVAVKFRNKYAIQALAGAGAQIYLKNLQQQTAYCMAEMEGLLPTLLHIRY